MTLYESNKELKGVHYNILHSHKIYKKNSKYAV